MNKKNITMYSDSTAELTMNDLEFQKIFESVYCIIITNTKLSCTRFNLDY